MGIINVALFFRQSYIIDYFILFHFFSMFTQNKNSKEKWKLHKHHVYVGNLKLLILIKNESGDIRSRLLQ